MLILHLILTKNHNFLGLFIDKKKKTRLHIFMCSGYNFFVIHKIAMGFEYGHVLEGKKGCD